MALGRANTGLHIWCAISPVEGKGSVVLAIKGSGTAVGGRLEGERWVWFFPRDYQKMEIDKNI